MLTQGYEICTRKSSYASPPTPKPCISSSSVSSGSRDSRGIIYSSPSRVRNSQTLSACVSNVYCAETLCKTISLITLTILCANHRRIYVNPRQCLDPPPAPAAFRRYLKNLGAKRHWVWRTCSYIFSAHIV